MIVRGDTCLSRVTIAVRSIAAARICASLVARADLSARACVAVSFAAGVQGRDGKPGTPAGLATYVAAALVSGDKALMFAGLGQVVHADPTVAGYVYAGIALSAAQLDAPVEVRMQGSVQADFWAWTLGANGEPRPVYTAPGGNLTQTAPTSGRLHLIGWALDARTIHLDPEPPVTFF